MQYSKPQQESPAQASAPLAKSAPVALGITWRAVLTGLLLMAVNAYWITVVEVRWYTLDGTSLPLFITPIFLLFCLCLLNLAARRLVPKMALQQGELLTIYVMLVIGTALASHDLIQNLFGLITHADRFATPESGYKDTFFKYLVPSRFLLVSDPTALKAFYQGGGVWYKPIYLLPFLGPLLWWGLFLTVVMGMCLCLNILLRKAWTEDEKLAFPLVQLPLAMIAPDAHETPFWRSKMMWAGFALAAAMDMLNGLHTLYPSLPYIEIIKQYNIGQYVTQRPWSAIGGTNISLYPFAIGLAYFMPLDLCFSCWFFFVARKLFQVVGTTAGWDTGASAGFPYFEQQASGGWIALGLLLAWSLRRQFTSAWNSAFGQRETSEIGGARVLIPDPAERGRYRFAFVGLGAGTLFLAWFSQAIGLTWWVALLFFGIFFLLALAITRVRAEFGTPHEIYYVNPRTILVTLFGVNTIGAQSLTALSVLYWFNRGYRAHPMPNQLESFKMAEGGRLNTNRLIYLLVFAGLAGLILACWANLQVTFTEGATAKSLGYKLWVGKESFDRLKGWISTPSIPNYTQISYIVAGFLLVVGLRGMRSAFLWWPFHPVGYALAVSFAMDYFWFAFFVSWLLKALIIRFGGMKAHNAFIPFFLGLILGDYVMGSLWAIYGPIQGVQSYKIFI